MNSFLKKNNFFTLRQPKIITRTAETHATNCTKVDVTAIELNKKRLVTKDVRLIPGKSSEQPLVNDVERSAISISEVWDLSLIHI